MKKRLEKEINPIYMESGDSLELIEGKEKPDGTVETNHLLIDETERTITINKVVTFDVEKGDFGSDVEDGIGGAFLNVKKKKEGKE